MNANSIKHRKTKKDKQGNFREYTVYKKGSLYIFECWYCVETDGNSGRGIRKACQEFSNTKEAIQKYEKYLKAWE